VKKQSFIVYSHYTVLKEIEVMAETPLRVGAIIKERLIKKKYHDPVIDKVMSLEEERALNSTHFNDL